MPWDVVIIGAGIGGLASGALLSKKGFNVLIFEKSKKIGGRAVSVEKNGFVLDYGIHLARFGSKGVVATTMKELGKDIEMIRPGESVIYWEEKFETLPLSVSTISSAKFLSPEEINELLSLLMRAIREDVNSLLDVPLSEWLEGKVKSENVKRLMRVFSTMLLVVPEIEKASAGELIDLIKQAVAAGEGAGYPKGGWKIILQKLKESVEENGGKVSTNTKVDKVIIENGEVKGVTIKDQKIEADKVIVAVPCQQVFSVLDKNKFPVEFVRKAENITPTCGVSIDFAISEPVIDISGMIVSENPPILGLPTSNLDPTIAPENKQLATFLLVIPAEQFAKRKDMELNNLEKLVYEMFPKLKGKALWTRKLKLPMVDGAAPLYNQTRKDRIPVKAPIKGLFFAGDSYAAPGGGGDIAWHTARKCVEEICKN